MHPEQGGVVDTSKLFESHRNLCNGSKLLVKGLQRQEMVQCPLRDAVRGGMQCQEGYSARKYPGRGRQA